MLQLMTAHKPNYQSVWVKKFLKFLSNDPTLGDNSCTATLYHINLASHLPMFVRDYDIYKFKFHHIQNLQWLLNATKDCLRYGSRIFTNNEERRGKGEFLLLKIGPKNFLLQFPRTQAAVSIEITRNKTHHLQKNQC